MVIYKLIQPKEFIKRCVWNGGIHINIVKDFERGVCSAFLIAYSEGKSLEHYSSGFEWAFAIADKPNDQRIFGFSALGRPS